MLIAWAVALCALAVVSQAAVSATRPQTPARADGRDARIAWQGCGERLECAHVRVPLDWDRPGARQIKLAVIRHLASKPDQLIGSMFMNPGGPGGSFAQVRDEGEDLDAVGGGRFNVVGWDVRGFGLSTHVRCFRSAELQARFFADWEIPTTRAASQPIVHKTRALARRCGELSGNLLRHISTADTARDLDYLRRMVGERKLTYLGISGGTFIGETYANLFPNKVRAIVLDGLVNPIAFTKGNKAGYVNQLSASVRGFEGFEALCESAGPTRCALAGHGSVTARVDELFARLRQMPIPAPTATPPGELTYADALQSILVYMSGGPRVWPDMATAFEAAARGDGSELLTMSRLLTNVFSTGPPGLPAIAMICADSPSRQGLSQWPRVIGRLTRVSYIYGPTISWWRWAPCASWPARSVDRYTGPWDARTKNKILVIGTRHDPNTPYKNAERVAGLLGNAVLITHAGYSHTSPLDPSACIKAATTRYLIDLVIPSRGTICAPDHRPFDPDYGEPLSPTARTPP